MNSAAPNRKVKSPVAVPKTAVRLNRKEAPTLKRHVTFNEVVTVDEGDAINKPSCSKRRPLQSQVNKNPEITAVKGKKNQGVVMKPKHENVKQTLTKNLAGRGELDVNNSKGAIPKKYKTKTATKIDHAKTKSSSAEPCKSTKTSLAVDLISGDMFTGPEFYSTLHLAQKLQRLKIEEFNEAEAIRTKLDSSPKTKQKIEERSVKPVNIGFKKVVYQNPVSINFDEKEILLKAAKEKEMKYKKALPQPRKRDPEPDIMEFYTDDLQKEFLSPCSIQSISSNLTTVKAPVEMNYILYKRMQSWNNPTDISSFH